MRTDPHPGQPGSPVPLDGELGQRANDGLLKAAQIEVHVTLIFAQEQDGVAAELARPVVGHVAPALDLEDRHARRGEQVLPMRAAAQGQHVGMFDQHQSVRNFITLTRGQQILLHAPRLRVVARSKVNDPCRFDHSPRAFRGT